MKGGSLMGSHEAKGAIDVGLTHDSEGNFEGYQPRGCGEHRTVGSHRAWCFDCSEWCYPGDPCVRCQLIHSAVIRQGMWAPACDPSAVDWTVPLARDPNQVTCPPCLAFCEGVTL